MQGKYTTRIEQLLLQKGMRWKHLGISTSTLDRCKKNDKYSSEQLDIISNALGISVSELTDFDGRFDKVREMIGEIDRLRLFLNENLEEVRAALDVK